MDTKIQTVTITDNHYPSSLKKIPDAPKVLYYCGKALVWHPVDVQRMTLGYLAKWYITLGRYRVLGDDQGKIPEHLTYYFGVPRYLIGEIMHNGLYVLTNIFNKPEFLFVKVCLLRNIPSSMTRGFCSLNL